MPSVAVTVAVPPASAMEALLILNVTLGGGSSSVMVADTLCSVASLALTTERRVTLSVSAASSMGSVMPVMVTVPLVSEPVMVTEVPETE